MDALPNDLPPPPATAMVAPAEIGPRNEREKELCRKADHTDWLYIGGAFVANVASIYADNVYFRFAETSEVRLMGPALVGASVGFTLGGTYLALPKCDPNWVENGVFPEGEVHSSIPTAIAIAGASAILAPFIARVEQGYMRLEWSGNERTMTVIWPSITGFAGALLPYVLSPRTWSAAKDLQKLRVIPVEGGATVGVGFRF